MGKENEIVLSSEFKYDITTTKQFERIFFELSGLGGDKGPEWIGRTVSTENQWIKKHGKARLIAITLLVGIAWTLFLLGGAASGFFWSNKLIRSDHKALGMMMLIPICLILINGILTGSATMAKVHRICKTPNSET